MKEKYYALLQFLKFNVVGLINTAVDFLIMLLLTSVAGMGKPLASTISYACGMLNSYILNTSWTFRKERKRTKREILLFVMINLVALGVRQGVLYLCENVFMIETDILCTLIAIAVSTVINFTGNRLFVFKNKAQADGGQKTEPADKPE